MSWLSEAIKKIGGKDKPAFTVPGVIGAIAPAVGGYVTDVLKNVGEGQSVGGAVKTTTTGALNAGAKAVNTAVDAAGAGIDAAGAWKALWQGPVPWVILGLLVAMLLRRRE